MFHQLFDIYILFYQLGYLAVCKVFRSGLPSAGDVCLDGVEVGGLPAECAEALLLVGPVHLRRKSHHVHLKLKCRLSCHDCRHLG